MTKFFMSYLVFEIVIVAAALACTLVYSYRRRHPKSWRPTSGFQKTDEVFIDPTTGIRQQVWYNPDTGERKYQALDS